MSKPIDSKGTAAASHVEDVARAAERLKRWAHRTPVLTSRTLDALVGGSVFLKCENFQRVGAFKFRGAMNALLLLSESERSAGVVTHSSGNHAQALSLAGQLLGVSVCVVMPRTAPAVKRAATEGYGARIVLCEPNLKSREEAVAREVAEHGYTIVHPFDNWDVMAGQGTVAWELIDEVGHLDMVVSPVGGGGLLAGTTLAVMAKSAVTRVYGVEPELADDAKRSLETGTIQPSGDPSTIADGLKTSLGERPFSVIQSRVDSIVTVSEAEIVSAMRFIWERLKIIIEPSSAVPVAALLTKKLKVDGRRVGVIIGGGNVDLDPYFQALSSKWL
ncbi:pyridoxal-phosphate dependent enzyme [Singulisphaera sp. PoT]|uniref:pyridoxal-phosphate dependent enzyme n=1 Tax=Singulisphaera sp. PoT TaxID=3411797 RepID=UPI003BF4E80E